MRTELKQVLEGPGIGHSIYPCLPPCSNPPSEHDQNDTRKATQVLFPFSHMYSKALCVRDLQGNMLLN